VNPSITKMALIRGTEGEKDLYEAGTIRGKTYLRSIPIDKLGSIDVNILDNKDDNDEDKKLNKIGKFPWEIYDNN